MQFTIDAKLLVRALRKVKGAIDKSNRIPILNSVVIETNADSVIFTATDLEVVVEVIEYAAFDQHDGSVVIPLEKVLKLARKLKGPVSFESADYNAVVIRCPERGSKTTLAGSPRDEFPSLPGVPEKQVEVDAKALGTAIATVLHAASKDETRYNLNGVYIDSDSEPTVRVVATDGHRLAVADAGSMNLPWKGGITVSLKGAKYLTDFLKGEDTVTVACESNALRVSGDSWSISTNLLEGEFPNYSQVIPKMIGETLIADPAQFSAALETAYEMAAERSKAVKIVLNDGLEFHTQNPDIGDSVVECPCERSGTETRTLAFNGKYLADAVAAVCDSRVMIEFAPNTPELSPIRISGSEPFPFCVVMPMRV